MNTILKKFLEDNLDCERLNETFDYSFNNDSSQEMFLIEFRKFLGIYNSFFYHENRLLTVFNSYEAQIEKKDLRIMFQLYCYANENKMNYHKYIIQDFLFTYFKTISTYEYKQNNPKYNNVKKDFVEVLKDFDIQNLFFTDFCNNLYDFYRELITYGFDNNIFIDEGLINKVFNNLKNNDSYVNDLVELFVNKGEYIHNVIYFDKKTKQHLGVYMCYIRESLNNPYGYNHAKLVVFELDKKRCLNENNHNEIINIYIKLTNDIVCKLKDKKYSFIRGISEIEILRGELLFLLNNIESNQSTHKNKIKECLTRLLRLKRYIVSDDNYVVSEMHERKGEVQISKNVRESFRNALLQDKFKLYAVFKFNFKDQLEQSLDLYSNYPLSSMVSKFVIDSQREVYLYNLGVNRYVEKNNFKLYFDDLGKEYTIKHPELKNKLSSNYYEELLKHMNSTFNLHYGFLLSIFSSDEIKTIINELKIEANYQFTSDYATVVSNILAIETNMIKILKINNLDISKYGGENLNNLFNLFKDDSVKVDGLMYLNYILYEKTGLNLRNNAMHGTLINEDLIVPLIATFSGLIFISWLLSISEVN